MILALDIAKRTGWAIGSPHSQPVFGEWDLGKGQFGERGLALFNRLDGLLGGTQIETVVFESPHGGPAGRVLMGYCAIAEVACAKWKVPVREVQPNSWRKHFLGHGGLKREDAKAACIRRCNVMGWAAKTDNEADALGILDFAVSLKSPAYAARTAGMFA